MSVKKEQSKDIKATSIGRVSLTSSLERVFTLVGNSVEKSEPVLLVGGTGCGKTTACQLLAEKLGRPLYILNCHQHTETSDILGGLRPVRGREKSLVMLRKHAKFVFDWISCGEAAVWINEVADNDADGHVSNVLEWLKTIDIPKIA